MRYPNCISNGVLKAYVAGGIPPKRFGWGISNGVLKDVGAYALLIQCGSEASPMEY